MIWNVSKGGKARGRFPAGAGYITGMALFVVILLGSPALSMAQSNSEVRALVDRINRLEKDLTDMQRQIYNSGGISTPRSAPPAAATPSPSGADNIGSNGLNLLMRRISTLEEQQRRLTGAQEETSHKLDRISSRLDKLVQDVEYRLTNIESRLAGGGAAPQGGLSGDNAPPASGSGPTIIDGSSQSPSGDGTLGTLPTGAADSSTSGSTASTPGEAATASTDNQLPNGSVMEQYNHAISLIRDDRYAEAEVAFSEFLQNHKDSELAGNAQYWLGETFYVRGDFPNAASAFFEGYQSYPDSSKAADNLLKLAMSLGRMDQQAEACATFAQMEKQFAQIPTRLQQTADREKQKYGCS